VANRRFATRPTIVVATALFLFVWAASPAWAASADSGRDYYYAWGSVPEEIFCGAGQATWSDAQTPATSPLSGMTVQQTSWSGLWCGSAYGMGAGYQYAEGVMFKWTGSSWSPCKTLSRVYNGSGGSSATSVKFNQSLCGVATYELEGHYGVAWAYSWHEHWNSTPGYTIS